MKYEGTMQNGLKIDILLQFFNFLRQMFGWFALLDKGGMPCLPGGGGDPGIPDTIDSSLVRPTFEVG